MGQAIKAGRRAFVFYERIASAASVRPDRDLLSMLGDIVAHELGHLMLPTWGHSSTGIMSPNVDLMSRRLRTFTPAEAALIRLNAVQMHDELAQMPAYQR